MKILFSLLLILSSPAYSACGFKGDFKRVYSLSGPVTKVLEEIGLIHQLSGISVFYPSVKNFKGEIIPGGIFLSPGKLSQMKGALVFFDQSQELRKVFARGEVTGIEVNGRNKTPAEVVTEVIQILAPYLADCDFQKVKEKVSALEVKISQQMKTPQKVVFFLGETKGKLPELVIVNDGLVMWLRKKGLIYTYPSELSYVNWSGNILERLKKDHLFLGLKEEANPELKGDNKRATLYYPGALTPGLHQLEAWNWYLEKKGH